MEAASEQEWEQQWAGQRGQQWVGRGVGFIGFVEHGSELVKKYSEARSIAWLSTLSHGVGIF